MMVVEALGRMSHGKKLKAKKTQWWVILYVCMSIIATRA
jgi:hypothetical protein